MILEVELQFSELLVVLNDVFLLVGVGSVSATVESLNYKVCGLFSGVQHPIFRSIIYLNYNFDHRLGSRGYAAPTTEHLYLPLP